MNIKTFDPHTSNGSNTKSLDKAIEGVDAVVIVTNHKEFLGLNPDELSQKGIKVVIDGRNCLDKERFVKAGLLYRGIGK